LITEISFSAALLISSYFCVFLGIYLLEKSSYEKMILGIEAWRQNPLNQLYRDITIESINQGRPIPEIIKQREVEKKDILSVEEFKTLINFNREITF
jgi:hypothetical protein